MEISAPWIALLSLPWAVAGLVLARWLTSAPPVVPGKFTVDLDGDFVVFIIGFYLDPPRWWWRLPVFVKAGAAMAAIKKELREHPEFGCLLVEHTEQLGMFNPSTLIQIWRSYDDLAAYARTRMGKHLGTWMMWDSKAQGFKDGEIPGVGIFHESYLVKAKQYEAVYRNTPRIGLAKIGTIVSASEGRMRSGKGRLGQSDGADHADREVYSK